MSTLITEIHTRHTGIVAQVDTPVTLTYSILDPADGALKTGNVSSKFVLPYSLSQQVTDATTQYYSDSSLITVTQTGT
jgi:hypothetical protein